MVGRLSRKTGSGWEACPEGRVHLPEGREWLGGHSGGLGVVGRPSRRAGSGWEALTEGRK